MGNKINISKLLISKFYCNFTNQDMYFINIHEFNHLLKNYRNKFSWIIIDGTNVAWVTTDSSNINYATNEIKDQIENVNKHYYKYYMQTNNYLNLYLDVRNNVSKALVYFNETNLNNFIIVLNSIKFFNYEIKEILI
jgi:hypothetical protein